MERRKFSGSGECRTLLPSGLNARICGSSRLKNFVETSVIVNGGFQTFDGKSAGNADSFGKLGLSGARKRS
jgi:hypothetical protein